MYPHQYHSELSKKLSKEKSSKFLISKNQHTISIIDGFSVVRLSSTDSISVLSRSVIIIVSKNINEHQMIPFDGNHIKLFIEH
jgi:hypothetical protein